MYHSIGHRRLLDRRNQEPSAGCLGAVAPLGTPGGCWSGPGRMVPAGCPVRLDGGLGRRYGDLGPMIEAAIEGYARDVRSRAFPGPEHVYGMKAKA